jgi:hypothetical protein
VFWEVECIGGGKTTHYAMNGSNSSWGGARARARVGRSVGKSRCERILAAVWRFGNRRDDGARAQAALADQNWKAENPRQKSGPGLSIGRPSGLDAVGRVVRRIGVVCGRSGQKTHAGELDAMLGLRREGAEVANLMLAAGRDQGGEATARGIGSRSRTISPR